MYLLLLTAALAAVTSRQDDSLISALATMKPGIEYSGEGAADASVMGIGENDQGVVEHPPPEIARIVTLGANAIPLLIAHLDDPRSTPNRFRDAPGKPVPVGFVCLNILTEITRGPMLVEDCADDGLGACITPGYFFRPDASRSERRHVKSNWERAFREHKVQFAFPSWWSAAVAH